MISILSYGLLQILNFDWLLNHELFVYAYSGSTQTCNLEIIFLMLRDFPPKINVPDVYIPDDSNFLGTYYSIDFSETIGLFFVNFKSIKRESHTAYCLQIYNIELVFTSRSNVKLPLLYTFLINTTVMRF